MIRLDHSKLLWITLLDRSSILMDQCSASSAAAANNSSGVAPYPANCGKTQAQFREIAVRQHA